MRRTDFRGLVRALALIVCCVLLPSIAAAQPRTAQQPVATQQTPMTPSPGDAVPSTQTPQSGLSGAAGPVSALTDAGDAGICQCIADRTTRRLSCLSSAAACQSNCASTHYAFTPHAIYSCATATTLDSTSSVMSPSR